MNTLQLIPHWTARKVTPDSAYSSHESFDRFFDVLFGNIKKEVNNSALSPRTYSKESKEAYSLELELPGVAEKDIEVNIKDQVLSIKAELKSNDSEGKETVLRNYERSFEVPDDVDHDHAEAKTLHGILTISLPRHEKVEKVTKLTVKSA
jgi:HSP20 family protein